MTSIQTFHKTLSDIISKEKLSASRVERIRNEVADNFDRADELVKIISKVHNSATSKTKISSLYLFDAMARCAQDVIKKRASDFRYKDSRPPKGSSALAGTKEAMIDAANAFLGACSRIVEEIVLTTAQSVREDQREKVAKVVDIWIKANTFDQSMLERIRTKALRGEGHSQSSTLSKEDDKGNSMPSPYGMLMNDDRDESGDGKGKTNSTPPSIPNVPANLLAMLGAPSSTMANKSQTNTVADPVQGSEKPAATSLDPNQLAMLRRVAAQQQQQQQEEHQQNRQGWQQNTLGNTNSSSNPPSTKQYGNETSSYMNDESVKPAEKSSSSSSSNFWPDQSVGDLSQFDLSAFDPTKSENWLQLAQQWFNTYQYIPSNQELMMGLMSVMQSQMYMQQQQGQGGYGASMNENDSMAAGGGMQEQYSSGWN